MIDKYPITNIQVVVKYATGTINAKASLSVKKMLMEFNGTEIEDFNKTIVNQEIRTPENIAYFKGLVLEVLQEQGLI